jgi:hypothetical protein
MRPLAPHEDLDTVADAFAIVIGHLLNEGVVEVGDDAFEMLSNRAMQYDEDEYAGLIETAIQIIARASTAH